MPTLYSYGIAKERLPAVKGAVPPQCPDYTVSIALVCVPLPATTVLLSVSVAGLASWPVPLWQA